MMIRVLQELTTASPLSWLAAGGGLAGLGALLAVGIAIGKWTTRIRTVEREVSERPTRAEVTGTIKALGKALDAVREDVRGIREDIREMLLGGRRKP